MAYDINAALERLEQNLQNLDSARKQVENTVKSSNELRQTVSEYVESLTRFRSELLQWEEHLKQLESGLSAEVHNAFVTLEASCEKISTGFKVSTDKTLSKFTEQNKILTERVNDLNTLRQELKSSMSEITTIKDILTNLTSVLTASQQDQDQALANIIGKVAELPVTVKGYTDDVVQQMDERHRTFNQKIEESISKTESVIQKIDILTVSCNNIQEKCDDIKASLNELKQFIDNSNASISKSININRWITIIAFVILIILLFIK